MSILADLIARHHTCSLVVKQSMPEKPTATDSLAAKLHYGLNVGMDAVGDNLYWWDEDPLALILATRDSVPDDWTLEEYYVDSTAGFWAFPKPIQIVPNDQTTALPFSRCEAIGWVRGFNLSRNRPMLLMGFFLLSNDGGLDRGTEILQWDFTTPVIDPEDNTEEAPEKQLPSYTPYLIKFFAGALQFLQQEIFVGERLRPDRGDVRRAERSNKPLAAGRLITLRHAKQTQAEGERNITWMHRWFVKGHWRKLETRYIYVRPHVKGPANKPFLFSQKGYHVRR